MEQKFACISVFTGKSTNGKSDCNSIMRHLNLWGAAIINKIVFFAFMIYNKQCVIEEIIYNLILNLTKKIIIKFLVSSLLLKTDCSFSR